MNKHKEQQKKKKERISRRRGRKEKEKVEEEEEEVRRNKEEEKGKRGIDFKSQLQGTVGANLREDNLGAGGKLLGGVANKLAPYEKKNLKNMGNDSKTEDQKKIKQNCFHRGYVRRCGYFGSRSRSLR